MSLGFNGNAVAFPGSFTAGATALVENKFYVISSGALVLAGAGAGTEGQIAFPVADNYAIGSQNVTLYYGGIAKAIVNGDATDITFGMPLKTTTAGVLIPCSADQDRIVAYSASITTITADGVTIDVLLDRGTFMAI